MRGLIDDSELAGLAEAIAVRCLAVRELPEAGDEPVVVELSDGAKGFVALVEAFVRRAYESVVVDEVRGILGARAGLKRANEIIDEVVVLVAEMFGMGLLWGGVSRLTANDETVEEMMSRALILFARSCECLVEDAFSVVGRRDV
jgi:hypothetical protein